MNRETAILNKIYRAIHDGVCPRCGGNVDALAADRAVFNARKAKYTCRLCGFTVTEEEMHAMRFAVTEWGKEAVEVFEAWRAKRNEPAQMP